MIKYRKSCTEQENIYETVQIETDELSLLWFRGTDILIDNLTTFIGNNSAGKTAALSALNCMFSENSGDRILQRSDFHLPKEMAPDEMES